MNIFNRCYSYSCTFIYLSIDPNRCDEIPTLKEGDFECENSKLIVDTKCKFVCPSDKVPVLDDMIFCEEFIDPKSNLSTFEWDKEISSFECVKIIRCLFNYIQYIDQLYSNSKDDWYIGKLLNIFSVWFSEEWTRNIAIWTI